LTHAVEARRLLRRLPDAKLAGLSAADMASIILLSRRHQLGGLISRCFDGSAVSRSVIERLGVEDVVWLIEGSELPHNSLDRIRQDLLANPQYSRMTLAAEALSAYADHDRHESGGDDRMHDLQAITKPAARDAP
jgi:hypothetical protein